MVGWFMMQLANHLTTALGRSLDFEFRERIPYTHMYDSHKIPAMRRRDPLAHGNCHIVQNSKTLEGIVSATLFYITNPQLLFGALTLNSTQHSNLHHDTPFLFFGKKVKVDMYGIVVGTRE
jgi:hypothetical protein